MPEELENQDAEVQELENPSEVEAKEEQRVPLSELLELRAELKQAKEEGNLTRQQMAKLMSDYQVALHNMKPVVPKAEKDQGVADLLDPYLEELREENRAIKEKLSAFESTTQQSAAERYLERNIPNLEEIRPDLLKEIQSYSREEQTEILANPREIARIAKMVTRLKAGKSTVQTENRSRARTETGSTSTRLEPDSASVDAKVAKWMKDNHL